MILTWFKDSKLSWSTFIVKYSYHRYIYKIYVYALKKNFGAAFKKFVFIFVKKIFICEIFFF